MGRFTWEFKKSSCLGREHKHPLEARVFIFQIFSVFFENIFNKFQHFTEDFVPIRGHNSPTWIQVVACRAQRGPPGLNLLLDKEQDKVQIIGDSIEEVERVELGALTESNGMLFDRNDVADCLKVRFWTELASFFSQ